MKPGVATIEVATCKRRGCPNLIPSAHWNRLYCSARCRERARARHRKARGPNDFTCWVTPATFTRLTSFPCGMWHASEIAAHRHVLVLRCRYGSLAQARVIQAMVLAEWGGEGTGEPAEPLTGRRKTLKKYNHSSKGIAARERYRPRKRPLAPTTSLASLSETDAADIRYVGVANFFHFPPGGPASPE